LILAREWPTHTRDLFYIRRREKQNLLSELLINDLLVDYDSAVHDYSSAHCVIEVDGVTIGLLYIELTLPGFDEAAVVVIYLNSSVQTSSRF
jgi:hypothetical protein